MKWENYLLKSGTHFGDFWADYLNEGERDVLFIMGMGFDPRTNVGLTSIFANNPKSLKQVIALRYFNNESEISLGPPPPVANHMKQLEEFLSNSNLAEYQTRNVVLRSEEDKSIGSINATKLFDSTDMQAFTDVILDVSAIPRSIFLPLLNKLLRLINLYNEENVGVDVKNLHVIVTENSELDASIHDQGAAEDSIFIHSLSINEMAKRKNDKEVWFALLGEGQTKQYEKIRGELDPVEVCPVLPFPSKDMKRADKLVVEHQRLLFQDPCFDPKNVIYAHEENPFQVYRLISKAISRFEKSLQILGGCKVVVSVFSSKLLTIGAFLAVFESRAGGKNVGIKHVESLNHAIDDRAKGNMEAILQGNNLVEMWLAGYPYEKSQSNGK